jgi:hypothetical protein
MDFRAKRDEPLTFFLAAIYPLYQSSSDRHNNQCLALAGGAMFPSVPLLKTKNPDLKASA